MLDLSKLANNCIKDREDKFVTEFTNKSNHNKIIDFQLIFFSLLLF